MASTSEEASEASQAKSYVNFPPYTNERHSIANARRVILLLAGELDHLHPHPTSPVNGAPAHQSATVQILFSFFFPRRAAYPCVLYGTAAGVW